MVVIHLLNIMAYDSAKAVSSGFIGALFAGFCWWIYHGFIKENCLINYQVH